MKLKYLQTIDSTNSYSKQNIDTLDDKTIVYTYNQTNGRGRFDRKWVDLGSENLFLSIILKPSNELKPVYSNLTQFTALKLSQIFEGYGISPKIKWPNDILINDKKISGILAETVFRNNTLKGLVIGIGINLNADKKDFSQINKKVTSLNLEINKNVDKTEFLEKFINNFFNDYEKFLNKGFTTIKDAYTKRANFLNKEISITNFDETITGTVDSINDNGAIVINGKEIYTGDII
ncbi:MAG: biotin--[acetyl-CoA-carboxylase] ligase [Candidatus Gastranaerophilaceae bacterium]